MSEDMFTLENDALRVTVAAKGAEMISLIDKKSGEERLWQADPAFWNRHAPVLFPQVGKHYNNVYRYGGQRYEMGQHGFARDRVFSGRVSEGNALTFVLDSDEQTRAQYPFDFSLEIDYGLEGSTLSVTWRVSNTGTDTMYFTIGAHPAFFTKPQKEDYVLCFPDTDSLVYRLLDPDSGCVNPGTYVLPLKNNRLALSDAMFEGDALIFDNTQIQTCVLERADGTPVVALHTPDFPNYGIWSKVGAPFVCLEPWKGRADDVGFEAPLNEKPGITALEAGGTFVKSYTIEVL